VSNNELSLFPYIIKEVASLQEAKQKSGWAIDMFDIPSNWEKSKGEGVKIGVLDTGCDLDHHDLKNNLLPGKNFINEKELPWDDNKHGTHVAGIIAAENNDLGIVGVAPKSKVVPIKVLDKYGYGEMKTICKGIKWAVDEAKVDFICLSLGTPNPVEPVRGAIRYALENKVITFVAAGNIGNTSEIFYPANYSEVIGIGSVDENLNRSSFSNTGNGLDFLAPGGNILSTVPNNWYALMSGTSMATPFAVGIAALLLSYVRKNKLKTRLETNLDYIKILKHHTISNSNYFEEGFGILYPKNIFDNIKSLFFDLFF
jgi:major intracellular serine protease